MAQLHRFVIVFVHETDMLKEQVHCAQCMHSEQML
jgi:hypothetical protein